MSKNGRPNILVIYTDQQRHDTLGANGNELIRTPNLDRLAERGVNFSRSYTTCPICVPSRVGFFTGRYNHTNLSYNNARLMFDRERDFAALLREDGYTTALIGKNHCFPEERLERTFDFTREAGHCAFRPPRNEVQERINEHRSDKMQVPFAGDPFSPKEEITGTLFREAHAYVGRDHDSPFFLWLSIPDPHPPYMVCEPYASMYDDVELPPPAWVEGETENKPYRQQAVVEWDRYGREYPGDRIDRLRRIYWGMVTYIDDELGKLMAALDERGLAEDTIVVFTSDHGDYMGDHRMIRKGPHLYEALTRVPLIVRWPGRVLPRPTDAMAVNLDVMPTLCDLIGIEPDWDLHGRSFAPLLLGEADGHRERVFMEHGAPGPVLQPGDLTDREWQELEDSVGHHLCPTIYRGRTKGVRSGRWKYCHTPGDVEELYDLEADPDELHNLADRPEHAAVIQQHREHILDWLIRTEDSSEE